MATSETKKQHRRTNAWLFALVLVQAAVAVAWYELIADRRGEFKDWQLVVLLVAELACILVWDLLRERLQRRREP